MPFAFITCEATPRKEVVVDGTRLGHDGPMRNYTNKFCRHIFIASAALLVLGILNYVVTSRGSTLVAALVAFLTGLFLRRLPVVRVGADQIEMFRGLLRPKLVLPFADITGIDESHSKCIRISTKDGELRIPTSALTRSERSSLIDDLRLGARQIRAAMGTSRSPKAATVNTSDPPRG
jgi:hypothetical protein